MSQPPHENIDVPNPTNNLGTFSHLHCFIFAILTNLPCPEIGDHSYPPHSARNQESQAASDFVNGSGQIFSMYLEMATEEDKKMAESWKDDADGILIFVRRYLSLLKLHLR
jgi:hypothetical protein